MDKKMIKILAFVASGFVLLIIFLLILSACAKKKFDFYKLQDEMIKAAKSYYQSKKDELPRDDGDTRTIALKKLINDGFMEEPSKTYKDESLSCDGSVTVSNNNGFYLFSPSLTCGKDHRTQLLVDKMLSDSLVETGIGLHEVGGEYIYQGEVKNNFIKFANEKKLFRIMKVNSDGTYRLLEHSGVNEKVWDNRYNADKMFSTGINMYYIEENNLNSRIKDTIKDYYNDSSVWSDNTKSYIVTQKLCYGKRSAADNTKDGSAECSLMLDNQQLGLLNVYEVLQASLDPGCKSTTSYACRNYNWYAAYSRSIWTTNGDMNSTHMVWKVNSGIVSKSDANSYFTMQTVFNISDKVTYVTGDGTEGNPYVVR